MLKLTYLDNLTAVGVAIAAKVPVILWGEPGQGKSSVLQTHAVRVGRHIETVIASIREPSDFAGLPIIDGNETRFAPPNWARKTAEEGNGIVFVDEISLAPEAVQGAMLRFVFEGVVGDLPLGDGTSIVAAANPPDTAADGWDLAAPLANRFLHLEWNLPAEVVREGFMFGRWPEIPELSFSDNKALQAAIAEAYMTVGAFIGARPDYVTRKPSSVSDTGKAWPSPRSWDMAARLLGYANAAGVSPQVRMMLLIGSVGESAAGEFSVYVTELDLPDPEEVLAKPHEWQVPVRGDRVFAAGASVIAAVEQNLTDQRWKAVGYVLAVMAEAGHADVAVSLGRQWMAMRPRPALMPDPKALTILAPIFREAKILP